MLMAEKALADLRACQKIATKNTDIRYTIAGRYAVRSPRHQRAE
jgi:hypothetical protein